MVIFKFDGSNIQVSSSDFFLGSSTQFVSGSNGNIEIKFNWVSFR